MPRCYRCGRGLNHPRYLFGVPFGAKCYYRILKKYGKEIKTEGEKALARIVKAEPGQRRLFEF